MSAAHVSRIEHGLVKSLDPEGLAILFAAVGLELSVRVFPSGAPLRDNAHTALLRRFKARLHPSVVWRTEVPMPIPGDLRAWDAAVGVRSRWTGVEAETRPRDAQALERRLNLKLRDSNFEHAILLLADTRYNRQFIRGHPALRDRFPLPGRLALEHLGAGADPGDSAIVLL
jgi:hypothetical protein